jgi:hypothetical protein
MDESTRGHLEFVAVQLAAVFAGLHFYWAFPRIVRTLQAGQSLYYDPRAVVFVVLAAAVIVGMVLVGQGVIPRPVGYALGVTVAVVSIVAWAVWHLGGHIALLPWVDAPSPSHVGNPLGVLAAHAVGDPIEGISKAVELGLAVTLGALLYDEYRADDADAAASSAGGETDAGR